MTAVIYARYIRGRDAEDFRQSQATVAHQPDGDLGFERVGGTGDRAVFLPTEPDVEHSVLVPFRPYCVLVLNNQVDPPLSG